MVWCAGGKFLLIAAGRRKAQSWSARKLGGRPALGTVPNCRMVLQCSAHLKTRDGLHMCWEAAQPDCTVHQVVVADSSLHSTASSQVMQSILAAMKFVQLTDATAAQLPAHKAGQRGSNNLFCAAARGLLSLKRAATSAMIQVPSSDRGMYSA